MVLSAVKTVPDSHSALTTLQIAIFIILFPLKSAQGDNYGNGNTGSCPDGANVDLTNVTENESGFTTHDGLFFPRDLTKLKDGVLQGCICDLKPCINLCYPPEYEDDEFWVDHLAIPKIHHANLTLEDEENAPSLDERFHYIHLVPCDPNTSFQLDPKTVLDDEFYLLGNGSLLLPRVEDPHSVLHSEWYCFDYFDANYTIYHPHVCLGLNDNPTIKKPETEEELDPVQHDESDDVDLRMVTHIAVLVSVPFLVATVIVYSIVPKLRNIHGTILRCYLCCLIISSTILGVQRISKTYHHPNNVCIFFGFLTYLSFLASFFWLNVMCFDMWWKFGGFGAFRIGNACYDRKKFICYTTHVSLSTSLLTIIFIIMEYSPGIPESMTRPDFGFNCWFRTTTAASFYLYGPFGVTIACNTLMFLSTSVKLYIHNRDTNRNLNNRESRRHNDNKQWFYLFLRLFVVMGITWTAEIISWYWGADGCYNRYLFTLDMVNALQGVLIFVILVCRRNVWRALKKYHSTKIRGEFNSRFTDFTSTRSNSQSAQSAAGLRMSDNGKITSDESIGKFSNFTNSSLVTIDGNLDQTIDDDHEESFNTDEPSINQIKSK